MATPVPLWHIHTTRTNCPTGHEGRAAPPETAYERPFCPATKPPPLHLTAAGKAWGPATASRMPGSPSPALRRTAKGRGAPARCAGRPPLSSSPPADGVETGGGLEDHGPFSPARHSAVLPDHGSPHHGLQNFRSAQVGGGSPAWGRDLLKLSHQ